MSGFLRGGVGFLKGTGEIIKGSSGVNREVRVGVTHVCVILLFKSIIDDLSIYLSLTPFHSFSLASFEIICFYIIINFHELYTFL